MNYKKKVTILSVFVAVLALTYILILFFDSDRRRDPSFAWLDPSQIDMADRIEVFGMNGLTVLRRVNNIWFISEGGIDYPVRQNRVEDLLSALTRRDSYPVRALSAEARERLGLGEISDSRIRVSGGAGLPLLDLLIGSTDAIGREVYLRRGGSDEIHSGEDRFTFFTEAVSGFWLDRRLFSAASTADVQQVEVNLPRRDSYVLRRIQGGWVIQGSTSALDALLVESWLRGVLEAEAENFSLESPDIIEATITLHMGDGQSKVLMAGPIDETNVRQVVVSDSSFVYLISEWTQNRLFRDSSFFLRD